MHDAPHAQPVTQQSPSVVTPPGQRLAAPLGLDDLTSDAGATDGAGRGTMKRSSEEPASCTSAEGVPPSEGTTPMYRSIESTLGSGGGGEATADGVICTAGRG